MAKYHYSELWLFIDSWKYSIKYKVVSTGNMLDTIPFADNTNFEKMTI